MDNSDINKFQKVPIIRLSNFDEKLGQIDSVSITGETVDILPYSKFFPKIESVTATFVKSFFIYKFTQILNGDFFRSQADNLTKFGQIILEDEIINPSGLFQANENINKKGNIPWIEYVYFNLYFKRNPNKNINNVDYEFVDPIKIGGRRTKMNIKKNYSLKKTNKKNKFTKKLNKKTKNNKKTKLNRKHKKMYKNTKRYKDRKRYKGGKKGDGSPDDEEEENYDANINLDDPDSNALAEQLSGLNLDEKQTPQPEPTQNAEFEGKGNEAEAESKENEGMYADDLLTQQATKNKDLRIKLKTELEDYFKKNLGSIEKDLEFSITGIDFADLRDIPYLVDDIIILYINDKDINESDREGVKNDLKQKNFAKFLNQYEKYFNIYENNIEFKLDNDFINFIYVYILLSSYKTAVIESQKGLGAFEVTSWWFFTQGDFIDIKNDLDLKNILKKYDEMIEAVSELSETSQVKEENPEQVIKPNDIISDSEALIIKPKIDNNTANENEIEKYNTWFSYLKKQLNIPEFLKIDTDKEIEKLDKINDEIKTFEQLKDLNALSDEEKEKYKILLANKESKIDLINQLKQHIDVLDKKITEINRLSFDQLPNYKGKLLLETLQKEKTKYQEELKKIKLTQDKIDG
jgi:hypothetical protein